jgi:hypothetical protein
VVAVGLARDDENGIRGDITKKKAYWRSSHSAASTP